MTKFVHIVRVHPVENGEPNTYKVRGEREFDTKQAADKFIQAYNSKVNFERRASALVAVYLGCVNDETGELV